MNNAKNKKDKIISMFLNGMKKGTICKNQHISPQKLNNIILKYQKEQSLNLYYLKRENINEICKRVKLDEKTFNEFITVKRVENQGLKQNGRSDWVTELTKRQKPVL